jgi:hypothetical protein
MKSAAAGLGLRATTGKRRDLPFFGWPVCASGFAAIAFSITLPTVSPRLALRASGKGIPPQSYFPNRLAVAKMIDVDAQN